MKRLVPLVLFVTAASSSAACGAARDVTRTATSPAATTRSAALELVESWPVETTLDHPDVPDAWTVWPDMIDGAKTSLDVAQFYISNAPDPAQSKLEPTLLAIERAAKRGVRVRILVEKIFATQYADSIERLRKVPGIDLAIYDVGSLMGGILHAKYFVVDGREAYVGSQNFDYRSLEHIQEMGLRVRVPEVAAELEDVFDTDFDLAHGAPAATRHASHTRRWPLRVAEGTGSFEITPVATPKGWLPDEALWTLPHLVALIDGAKKSVHVQVLHYAASSRDGTSFTTLDDALRRAASRGIDVELLVSSWSKKGREKESLDLLAQVPGMKVRVITIPEAKSGPIPFARVAHAKYMVVDGTRAWIGTSNWEGDYFEKTRNVGLVIEGGTIAPRLDAIFHDGWSGAYSAAW